MFEVKRAKRQRRPLKISLEGLSGSGKTFSALRLAFAMRKAGIGKRIVVADSENESASLYEGVTMDGEKWEFDSCTIPQESQNPGGYADVYEYLVRQGYDIIIIDSMSHAWHGALEQVDQYAQRNKGDKFAGWSGVTPQQRRMLSTITDSRAHAIVTMRVKGEYERTTENGKVKIRKVGMKTDQREGSEYEFDVVLRLDKGHDFEVDKVRGCQALDGKTGNKPGPKFWAPLFDWWLSAEPETPPFDVHTAAIFKAATIDELKAAFAAAYQDKRLTDDEQAELTEMKDRRKAALTEPATAVEQTGEMSALKG